MTDPTASPLARPLVLPCGAKLANRIGKAAMTEGLADAADRPTERHCTLYRRWSEGGAGLLVTGNVMIDRRYLERPGNVVLEDDAHGEALASWARAGTTAGNHLWMQLNHPGRQCMRVSAGQPVAPSAVPLRGMLGLAAPPRALTDREIEEIIERWARAAGLAVEAGFTGVQVHAAHGYLGSQFLSPHVNRRDDRWGGSLDNRARFLLETVRAVRERVGDAVPVSVKLNSADFQKGGFSNEEAAEVAGWLADAGVDLLEISGGTYEQMALFGQLGDDRPQAESTKRREAYFLSYAQTIREAVGDMPLMVTGGFRTGAVMEEAVAEGLVDVVGIARPFCVVPDCGERLLRRELMRLPAHERDLVLGRGVLGRASPVAGLRSLNGQAEVAWFYQQIIALAEGRDPDVHLGVGKALVQHFSGEVLRARARWSRRG